MKKGLIPVFKRELGRIFGQPSFVMMTIVFPLVIFFFFIAMFGKGVPRNIPIGVMDEDHSTLSRDIVFKLNAVPSIDIVKRVTSLKEGKELLQRGEIYSLIYLKKNLEGDMSIGLAPPIIHYYNNANLTIGGTLYKDVTLTLMEISSSILKSNMRKKGLSEPQAIAMSKPIRINRHVLFNPYTNYMYYLVSSLLPTMLHFFIILCAIYSLGIEIKEGTIDEAWEVGGKSVVSVITGKLLPYTIIFSIMGMFMLALFFGYLGFPLKGNITVLVVSTFIFVLAYQAMGMFFLALSGRILSAMLSASFYASTAFTFIGMTFPIVSMYKPAVFWAHLLPLTYYMEIYIDQAMRGAPLTVTARPFFMLTVFLIIPFFLLPRFKTLFTDETKRGDWGRLK